MSISDGDGKRDSDSSPEKSAMGICLDTWKHSYSYISIHYLLCHQKITELFYWQRKTENVVSLTPAGVHLDSLSEYVRPPRMNLSVLLEESSELGILTRVHIILPEAEIQIFSLKQSMTAMMAFKNLIRAVFSCVSFGSSSTISGSFDTLSLRRVKSLYSSSGILGWRSRAYSNISRLP